MVPWYMVTFEEFDFHTGNYTHGMKIMKADDENIVKKAMCEHLKNTLAPKGVMLGKEKIVKMNLQTGLGGVEELVEEK